MNDDLFDKYPNHTGIAMLLFVMFFAGSIVLAGKLGIIGTLICIAIVIGCWCGIAHLWDKIKKDMTEKRITKNYERGNYYDTFEHTKQSLMQNKNTTDYLKLGYMYENGYGTTKDYGKAMQCYQKANAWREIGYMHYFGYGVYKDRDRANEYFAKSGDKANCKQIISYFERIANNSNDANALYNLGWHYAEGKGISQDYQKALYYYKKAADLDNKSACNNLGCMYDSGKGVERDYSLAVRYFQKGADLGNATACNNVGSCYEYGEGGLLGAKPDKYKALKYYKKACDLGNQNGCENFKRLKNEMGIRNDDDVLF